MRSKADNVFSCNRVAMGGCGCGKKNAGGTVHFMGREGNALTDPAEWGPILWKYLHCLAEKCGYSNNKITDADQANSFEILIGNLPLILPCTECQGHSSVYLSTFTLPTLKGLEGEALRNTIREWLYHFHNHVRNTKGQPILVPTLQDCISMYGNCFVPKCEYTAFVQSVAFAVRQGWVRIDHWRKWYSVSEKMRLLVGNVVM